MSVPMTVDSNPQNSQQAQNKVRTTCPYCGVGCGVVVALEDQGRIDVKGDREHPANFGRMCSKGTALGETIDLDGRLLHPMVDGQQTDWTSALDTVAERFGRIIDRHGPDAVAFYVSGQLLTEDYYVANKLMKGFIGSANIDTNSRLCMSSAVAAYKRAFGSDTVPNCYDDLELADLVVLVGSNLAWCHPVLYQRLLGARKTRPDMRLVVIDPRRTATCDAADLHLPIRPGSDAVLFSGLLNWLQQNGYADDAFLGEHTEGLDEALRQAAWYASSIDSIAAQCGLDEQRVLEFFHLFASTDKTVTMFSQGVNQSTSGTDKGNAIINCHLLTGRIGKLGAGPFSITGQPNAMGGREVGGLANQLAAHMDIDNPGHRDLVGRFWRSDRVASAAGLKAVDLFRAMENGDVKAVWIMATNPAVSLPDTAQVRRALAKCDCVVVSDCMALTDTQSFADIRLPAQAWGEKDGTVTNSERRISRQRAFLPSPGEAKPDWWILGEVAKRLGYEGFDYSSPKDIFIEHAQLSGFENDGSRDFDISGLAGLDATGYEQLEPVQWPCSGSGSPRARMFDEGRFYTDNRKAKFVAVIPRPPANVVDADYPLIMNTGRVRDHWHTMTRTGKSPRLSGHIGEPFVAIHPVDALRFGIANKGLATVSSRWGRAVLRAEVTEAQQPGQVFSPIHWNDQFASQACIGGVVNPAVDPVSGQPEFKHTPVKVEACRAKWYGFLLSRRNLNPQQATYWSKARRKSVWHIEMAGDDTPEQWASFARQLLCVEGEQPDWRELHDSTQANYRAARIVDGRLDAVLIVGPAEHLPPRDWLAALFEKESLDATERARLLRGTPPSGAHDAGPVVCACFSVGLNTLTEAIRKQGLDTPEAIGRALSAGTNCGSCVPEIKRLIADCKAKSN